MKRNPGPLMVTLILLIGYLLSPGVACSEEVEALKGLSSVKAVIGFSAGDPKKAVLYLTLIGDTLKDPNIQAVTKNPDFVVSFGGPSVKLLAKDTKGFSPEEQKLIEEMKAKISALAQEGVTFEYCMYAAKVFGVEPAEVPGLKVIDNGWVSLIGYQARGYSFLPAN